MSIAAIAGLLFAASLHATWNLLAKRARDSQAFLIAMLAVTTLILLPLAVLRFAPFEPVAWLVILLSGALEAAYLMLLGGAYRHGDMSLVYPISRGSSPLFVALIAAVVLGERISDLGALGIALTVIGIYVVHLRSFARDALVEPLHALRTSRSSQLALLSGFTIASYSVVDKIGVGYVDPVVYFFAVMAVCCALLAPFALKRKRDALATEMRVNWRAVGIVAVLNVVGYLLILIILATNKASYATSVRGASVVFGAVLGAVVLKEAMGNMKIFGASIIFAGIICIGLAQ
jgi:drug/metabolite transporter (DMT)-like permease